MESRVPDHVIRLRGPWEYRPLARTVPLADGSRRCEPGDLPAPGRITMPADWGPTLGPDFRGRVSYCRRFGCPTGLGAGDRVELVIDRVDAFGCALLNGRPLGEIAAGGQIWRGDITARLMPRNELVIEVELPYLTEESPPLARLGRDRLPGGLIGEVRLEIFVATATGGA
jgi:hypothetical protein